MNEKVFDIVDQDCFRQIGSVIREYGTLQMTCNWPSELANCGVGQRNQRFNTTIGYEVFSHTGSEMVYRLVSDDFKSQRTDTDHAIVNLVDGKGTIYYRGVGTNSHIFGENGHTANRDYLRAGTCIFSG